MKKIIYILLLCILVGCTKVKPIEESDLKIYLYGRDNFIVDNRLNGQYEMVSQDGEVMKVKYSGENCLLKYEAQYTVNSKYKNGKWEITSFIIDSNDTQLQDISADLIELVKKSDENISLMNGSFKIHQLKIVENKALFSMTFEEQAGNYKAYFEGTVVSENNRLTLERIIERIYEKSDENIQQPIVEDNDEYVGDSKLIYDYYISKDMQVENIEIIQSSADSIQAKVKVADLWQYLKEVYEIEVVFQRVNSTVSPIEEEIIEEKILSRIVGKFVNQDRIFICGDKRSYIILNEDFSFTLYENNLSGFETLEEYYYVSYDKLTLRNREGKFQNHSESFEFEISSLDKIICQTNIITTRNGDCFVKVEE